MCRNSVLIDIATFGRLVARQALPTASVIGGRPKNNEFATDHLALGRAKNRIGPFNFRAAQPDKMLT
jgi:hypothetical protein